MPTKAQFKFIRSLQSRKVRDELSVFVAEGPKVVEELMAEGRLQVQDVFATPRWAAEHGAAVERRGGAMVEISDADLDRLSGLATGNQVLAVFSKPRFPGEIDFRGHISLVLDGVQDPGNVGTIIRSADWFGLKYVVCGPGCADPFNSKVIQSTMGSIARVQVIQETDLTDFLEAYSPIAVVAATLDGKPVAEMPRLKSAFLLIGNESRGVNPQLIARASYQITIPRRGQAESLNAAIATSVLLSHMV